MLFPGAMAKNPHIISATPILTGLLVCLAAPPALGQTGQNLDEEAPPAAAALPGQQPRLQRKASRAGEIRLEANAGYGGVTNMGASTGGVQVHGPAAGAAAVMTWPLSGQARAGIRLGCVMGWGLNGQSFRRDETGAPASTDAYAVNAAFQTEVRGRWFGFRIAPGLGVLHLRTEEGPTRDYPGSLSHDSTLPELTLSLGLDLNLHRHVALTVSAEAGTLLVQTRWSVLGGLAFRL